MEVRCIYASVKLPTADCFRWPDDVKVVTSGRLKHAAHALNKTQERVNTSEGLLTRYVWSECETLEIVHHAGIF